MLKDTDRERDTAQPGNKTQLFPFGVPYIPLAVCLSEISQDRCRFSVFFLPSVLLLNVSLGTRLFSYNSTLTRCHMPKMFSKTKSGMMPKQTGTETSYMSPYLGLILLSEKL